MIEEIDRNCDGVLSEAEQKSYAQRVVDDLTLTANGQRLTPTLASAAFPQIEQMRMGQGEIHIHFTALVPSNRSHYRVILENHHQNLHSVYLVNAKVSSDPSIHILSQDRNKQQSRYERPVEILIAVFSAPVDQIATAAAIIWIFKTYSILGTFAEYSQLWRSAKYQEG